MKPANKNDCTFSGQLASFVQFPFRSYRKDSQCFFFFTIQVFASCLRTLAVNLVSDLLRLGVSGLGLHLIGEQSTFIFQHSRNILPH